MAEEDLRSILASADAASQTNKGKGAETPVNQDGDLSDAIEALRRDGGLEVRPQERTYSHEEGSSRRSLPGIDELAYQEQHHQTVLNGYSSEMLALDGLIDVDQARIQELQYSLEQKVAERRKLEHLYKVTARYLEELRGVPN